MKSKPQAAKREYVFKGFVNVGLSKDDKAKIKAIPLTLDDCESWLIKLVEANIKVSLTYDRYNTCYSCSLVPNTDHYNTGYILTGRGSTPLKALRQAIYMLSIIPEDWSEGARTGREVIDD